MVRLPSTLPLPILLLALSCGGSPGSNDTVPAPEPRADTPERTQEETAPASDDREVAGVSEEPQSTAGQAQPTEQEAPGQPEVQEPVTPSEPPSPIRVALYRAPGVSFESHQATLEVLREARGFVPRVLGPEEVRGGSLDGFHVVIFTGGRGSVQGSTLEEEGRQIVRDFVAAGGGYIGVCAGSYLAMQGEEEFHKISIVAARNLTGDSWRRGEHTVEIREVGGDGVYRLFYANGPVFARVEHETIRPYIELATFLSDAYLPRHGTHSGEMPGTPAILASAYGRGRVILFSPNPVLSAEGESPVPELMIKAVRWVATPGPVPSSLQFADVFR